MLGSTNAAPRGLGRLLAATAAVALLAAPAPAAQAGSHDGSGPGGRGGAPPAEEDADGFTRVAGTNRFQTAVALSQRSHPDGADELFVATGGQFADGLTAGAAAAAADAPMLFATPGSLPGPVGDEVMRLDPETVTVPGGPAAVGPAVIDRLEALLPGAEIVRLGGGDRFETAVEISNATHPGGSAEVFLATGGRFPDALAAAPLAASLDAPVLLAESGSLPAATGAELERLAPETVTVLGGTAAVSDDVLDEVQSRTGAETVRIAGADRFATAIAASQFLTDGAEADTVYVATGVGWADALAGAAAAGADAAPVLLTTPGQLPPAVGEELRRLAPDDVVVLGGPAAIAARVADDIADVLDAGE